MSPTSIARFQAIGLAIVAFLLSYRLIWEVALEDLPYIQRWHFTPVHTGIHWLNYTLSVCGFVLLYTAYQVWRRRKRAWLWSIVLLSMICFGLLWHGRSPLLLAGSLALLAWLSVSQRFYTGKNQELNIYRSLLVSGFFIGTTFIYGMAGLWLLGPKLFHVKLSLVEAVQKVAQDMVSVGTSTITAPTRRAERFIETLATMEVISWIVIASSLYRPVQFALSQSDGERNRQRMRQLIQRYGASSDNFLKLYPKDKHYFFALNNQAALAYGVYGSTALILGGPVGVATGKSGVVAEFYAMCQENGWSMGAINIHESEVRYFQQLGMKAVQVGNEAVVSVNEFVAQTMRRSRHFRNIINRAKREGLTVEFWSAPTAVQLKVLRRVSDEWLKTGKREYGFFMGYFDEEYLSQCLIAALLWHGRVVAYTNVLPPVQSRNLLIDQMRHAADAPRDAMQFLITGVLQWAQEQGVVSVNLGLSPLSESESDDAQTQQLFKALRRIGGVYYSFEGLRRFKDKFFPDWKANYICLPSYAAVPKVVQAIAGLSTYPKSDMRRKQLLYGLLAAALLLWLIWQLSLSS